jgi:hypothetical protein
LIGLLATGDLPAMLSLTPNHVEFEKAMFSLLSGGAIVVVMDNVNVKVDHPSLAMALTAGKVTSRKLGHSEMGIAPNNAVWFVTANNATLGDDIARRTVYVRIDRNVEMPYLQTGFKYPRLLEHVRANRDSYIRDALVLVRHWIKEGRPAGDGPSMGKFESWRDTLGGILQAAGFNGFLQNHGVLYSHVDSFRQDWGSFLGEIFLAFGSQPFTARELGDRLIVGEILRAAAPDAVRELLNGDHDPSMKLGHLLKKYRDRVFGDYRLTLGSKASTNVNQWQVEAVKPRLTLVA